MALEDFLAQRCSILGQATGQDTTGGINRDPRPVLWSNVPCLLRSLSGTNDPVNDKAEEREFYRIYFDRDFGLTSAHQLAIGDRHFVPSNVTDYNSLSRLFVVVCEEVAV